VRVHYDEGAAIHIGPESCAGGREVVREALTGECAGQPLSREKSPIRRPTCLITRKAITQAPAAPAWSKTLACAEALCTGTRRSRIWPAGGRRGSASERREAVAGDARIREV
jgi:hypothetical protein